MVGVVMDKLLSYDFVTSLVDEANSRLNAPTTRTEVSQLQNRMKVLDRRIMRLIDLAEEVEDTVGVAARLNRRQEERQKLRSQLRVLESDQETIDVPRDIVEELLAEMRDPLVNGTLNAQRAVLKSTVGQIVVEKHKAQLYYLFPCATLYQVPPARLERAHTASEAAALSA